MTDARRNIPAVERLLTSDAFAELTNANPRPLLVATLQAVQRAVRAEPESKAVEHSAEWYARQVSDAIASLRSSTLRRVINATGVVLHTNLGRAPLAEEAIAAMQGAAAGYSTLEYDVARGKRGSRYDHCARLLRHLTGAEDALVVNNNAAALVLALNTLARGKNAIVSRGELVEIGGSFRVPDIMARSGARLREVGSTNRTHASDYAEAIDARTGALLKVHRSNFRLEGYTADVDLKELTAISHERDVPLIYDLGSGLLDHAAAFGLPGEPTARDALAAGAMLVTISGDKLLGGPQAGILLGSAACIAALRKNPLCRALRVDKITLAGLEATLILHLDPALARARIPALRMLTTPLAELTARADAFIRALATHGIQAKCATGASAVGGGAAPGSAIETALVRVAAPAGKSAASFEKRLRTGVQPVVARIEDDMVVIDLRTVALNEEADLLAAIRAAS